MRIVLNLCLSLVFNDAYIFIKVPLPSKLNTATPKNIGTYDGSKYLKLVSCKYGLLFIVYPAYINITINPNIIDALLNKEIYDMYLSVLNQQRGITITHAHTI